MNTLKQMLKQILPASWFSLYHRVLSMLAPWIFGHPSKKLMVIGVTGTKGKSTTGNMLWKILTDAGHTVGLSGTLNFRIGNWSELSTYKMTMSGRFQLQRWMHRMLRAGCDVAIIETTSEGIKQWRHLGIHYDICVLTNLTVEHLEAHGGFENYKQAKLDLFRHLARLPVKHIHGKTIPKVSVVNVDSSAVAEEFLSVGSHTKVRVRTRGDATGNDAGGAGVTLTNAQEGLDGTRYRILAEGRGIDGTLPLLGGWNAANAAMAVGVATALGVSPEQAVTALQTMEQLPGRMELINEGQPFRVVVDYAYEPLSLELLYRFWREKLPKQQRMITLISSTGGGRDVARRPKNGAVAATYCDFVIVTDEDPYDDDPMQIIDQVAAGALQNATYAKKEGENLWRILDRREAIVHACALAQAGDVVFLTAKGAEQRMCHSGGRKIPWDDRAVVREVLQQRVRIQNSVADK